MKNVNEIRFVATNYFNLQGLRMVPMSLLLVLVALWANGLKYPISTTSWLIVIFESLVMSLVYIGIGRYYRVSFGQVKRTAESLRLEWLVQIIGGILAGAAIWLDMTKKLPISLIGFVFGIGLLADYLRMTWLVKGRYLLYYPIGAVLFLIVGLLPLLGLPGWWTWLGIKYQFIAVPIVIGIYMIFAGIWGHVFLVRTLTPTVEEK